MPPAGSLWIDLSALAALGGIVAYALLGGADFGGGIWDLLATGPRKKQQRLAIQKAMGPVWEANHVWLIFVIVVLFTAFPRGYAAIGIALFLPFHLALIGIMLRGASFIFRSYQSRQAEVAETSGWGVAFGVASTITPVLLGMAFGAVTEGRISVANENQLTANASSLPWLTLYSLANGLLALATCAYLAAVYLTNETDGHLREDFRLRAIFAGTATAALAGLVIVLAWFEARWFFDRLLSWRTVPIIALGLCSFAASAWSVFTRRYVLSRVFVAAEIGFLLWGWGLAQYPYLAYPDLPLAAVAAPEATLRFLVLSIPVGGMLLIPSLWLLFRVFKTT